MENRESRFLKITPDGYVAHLTKYKLSAGNFVDGFPLSIHPIMGNYNALVNVLHELLSRDAISVGEDDVVYLDEETDEIVAAILGYEDADSMYQEIAQIAIFWSDKKGWVVRTSDPDEDDWSDPVLALPSTELAGEVAKKLIGCISDLSILEE